jgi:hypothetical protein
VGLPMATAFVFAAMALLGVSVFSSLSSSE